MRDGNAPLLTRDAHSQRRCFQATNAAMATADESPYTAVESSGCNVHRNKCNASRDSCEGAQSRPQGWKADPADPCRRTRVRDCQPLSARRLSIERGHIIARLSSHLRLAQVEIRFGDR